MSAAPSNDPTITTDTTAGDPAPAETAAPVVAEVAPVAPVAPPVAAADPAPVVAAPVVTPSPVVATPDHNPEILASLAADYQAAKAIESQIQAAIPPALKAAIDSNATLNKLKAEAAAEAQQALSKAHSYHATLVADLEKVQNFIAEKLTQISAYLANPTVPPAPVAPPTLSTTQSA